MPKKKGFTPNRYLDEILIWLKKEPFMSTSELCKKMGMGYETGLKYLETLVSKEKIRLKKVGNRKFWFI